MSDRDPPNRDGVSPQDLAKELQMDASLHELAGVVPNAALAARIREGVAQGKPTPGHRAKRWVTAAGLIIGVGVVAAVAFLRTEEQHSTAGQPQDPPTGAVGSDTVTVSVELKPPQPAHFVTLIADYSDNRVVEVDENGIELWRLEEVFGAWDAERLANGNYLITDFSPSLVREVDRQGRLVWSYDDLKNPYDADRLPNGNTLIADTFNGRVIEVNPNKEIVWELREVVDRSFQKTDIRPFDADRLDNGNTLICDVLHDRVIEVDLRGNILWLGPPAPNAHDADRLPNGNTLVTLRNKGVVMEVSPTLRLEWQIEGLHSPSDADRLPNGNTLVAENSRVREFDKDGKEVWRHEGNWPVEANRYPR